MIDNTRRCIAALITALFFLGGCATAPPLPRAPWPEGYRPVVATRPPTPSPTPEPTPTPEPATPAPTPTPYAPPQGAFAPKDLAMMGIEYLSSMEDILAELGEAPMSEESVEEVTGLSLITLAYDGLFLMLKGGDHLTGVSIVNDGWPGPRDIRVGATLEEVLAAFSLVLPDGELPQDEGITDAYLLFYGDQQNGKALPPLAELSRDVNENGAYVLRLIAPMEPYSEEDRQKNSYVFRQHAGCSFYFDEQTDQLARIYWYVGTLTE